MSTVTRETRETRVTVSINLIGEAAAARVSTTEPFLDHMVGTLARYAGIGLGVEAAGDLRHHLVEDVGITIGMALRKELPAACARYGAATVPMDEALVEATLDVGGRFYYEGPLASKLYDHFLRSLAEHAGMTLHVRVLRGTDRHHIVEAAVKAVGLALRQALRPEGGVFSTKGMVSVTWEEGT
ncbi:MAG TPA: imidazoleglycerol-phosphate dehydratase [Longimicrobiales bacterium]|nr:imidazoleglycerol-phosphate dehydratase [Longimicrobiales bacterium]